MRDDPQVSLVRPPPDSTQSSENSENSFACCRRRLSEAHGLRLAGLAIQSLQPFGRRGVNGGTASRDEGDVAGQ